MRKYIVAIDPDLHNNGYAIYSIDNKEFNQIISLPMWSVFEWVLELHKASDIIVLLEYPENTNTYHLGGKGAALNVGKNQAVAIILKEYLEFFSIKHKLLKPKGYSKYFDNESFFKLQTGWNKRTNKDARAAAAMIFLNKNYITF